MRFSVTEGQRGSAAPAPAAMWKAAAAANSEQHVAPQQQREALFHRCIGENDQVGCPQNGAPFRSAKVVASLFPHGTVPGPPAARQCAAHYQHEQQPSPCPPALGQCWQRATSTCPTGSIAGEGSGWCCKTIGRGAGQRCPSAGGHVEGCCGCQQRAVHRVAARRRGALQQVVWACYHVSRPKMEHPFWGQPKWSPPHSTR